MKSHLELKQFISQFVIIHLNLLGIVLQDEIVERCKCRQNLGLNTHAILQWDVEDSKVSLEDPKDPLNNIAS